MAKHALSLFYVALSFVLLTLTSPTYAALPSAISIIEQSISQQDGVYFYDKDTSGLYFTDLNVPDRNMDGNNPFAPNRIGISNDSLDYVVFDESVVVELYYDTNQTGLQIEVRYNEEDNKFNCVYQYDERDNGWNDSVVRTEYCNSSKKTALRSYQIAGESVYVLDLHQLCSWDKNGDGTCTSNIQHSGVWGKEVSSFSIEEVGRDVDVNPTLSIEPTDTFVQEEIPLDLARRVSNFYNWAVSVGALLALAVIIYGGVLYSASAGNSSRIGEAKTWIQRAIFGLILLFSSYIILNTINPDLTKLEDAFLTKNVRIGTSGVELTGSGRTREQCEGDIVAVENTPNYGGSNCASANGGNAFYVGANAPVGNFGDPSCDRPRMGRTAFVEELRNTVESELRRNTAYCERNVDRLTRIMVDYVAKGESFYNPNAFAACSASERGAFGLFQMNPVNPDNPNSRNDTPTDRGDVPWREQVRSAILKLREDGGEGYWAQWPGHRQDNPWPKLVSCGNEPELQ